MNVIDYSCSWYVHGVVMKKISESEWAVLNALYQKTPATAREVISRLSHKNWSEQTIKTLINRLRQKGIVTFVREKNFFVYSPVMEKDQLLHLESRSFLDKVMNKVPFNMLCQLVEQSDLSETEVEVLHRMLDSKTSTEH